MYLHFFFNINYRWQHFLITISYIKHKLQDVINQIQYHYLFVYFLINIRGLVVVKLQSYLNNI